MIRKFLTICVIEFILKLNPEETPSIGGHLICIQSCMSRTNNGGNKFNAKPILCCVLLTETRQELNLGHTTSKKKARSLPGYSEVS